MTHIVDADVVAHFAVVVDLNVDIAVDAHVRVSLQMNAPCVSACNSLVARVSGLQHIRVSFETQHYTNAPAATDRLSECVASGTQRCRRRGTAAAADVLLVQFRPSACAIRGSHSRQHASSGRVGVRWCHGGESSSRPVNLTT